VHGWNAYSVATGELGNSAQIIDATHPWHAGTAWSWTDGAERGGSRLKPVIRGVPLGAAITSLLPSAPTAPAHAHPRGASTTATGVQYAASRGARSAGTTADVVGDGAALDGADPAPYDILHRIVGSSETPIAGARAVVVTVTVRVVPDPPQLQARAATTTTATDEATRLTLASQSRGRTHPPCGSSWHRGLPTSPVFRSRVR